MPPGFAESLDQDSPDEESQSLGWAGDAPFVHGGQSLDSAAVATKEPSHCHCF